MVHFKKMCLLFLFILLLLLEDRVYEVLKLSSLMELFTSAPLIGFPNSNTNRSNIVLKYRYNGMTIKKNSFVCYSTILSLIFLHITIGILPLHHLPYLHDYSTLVLVWVFLTEVIIGWQLTDVIITVIAYAFLHLTSGTK